MILTFRAQLPAYGLDNKQEATLGMQPLYSMVRVYTMLYSSCMSQAGEALS
jgi:hypothetical protein